MILRPRTGRRNPVNNQENEEADQENGVNEAARIKNTLLELVENFFQNPMESLAFVRNNKIVKTETVLNEKCSVNFKPKKVVEFLTDVVDFPREYIQIKVSRPIRTQ